MRIVEWGKPLELRETIVPESSGRSVLVKVQASGVCHTDVHIIGGFYDLGEGRKLSMADRGIALPITPGHEIAGTVERLGPEVKHPEIREGTPVVVYPWIGCGTCRKCAAGLENICEARPRTLGIFTDGGYADYVLVPDAKYLIPLDTIDPEHGAPLACSGLTALSAVKKSRPASRELVVVLGAGGLGTTAIQLLKNLKGAKVVVVDVDDAKLALAKSLGADLGINTRGLTNKEVVAQIKDANGGLPADAAIDFVGTPATSSLGFEALGRGGRLVLVGLFGGEGKFALPFFPLRAAEVIGNFTGTIQDLSEMVELVQRGVVKPVVSQTYPLSEANLVLEKLVAGKIEGRAVLAP